MNFENQSGLRLIIHRPVGRLPTAAVEIRDLLPEVIEDGWVVCVLTLQLVPRFVKNMLCKDEYST